MNLTTESRIDALLTSWWEHQELRRQGASVAELSRSAVRLDEARRLVRN